MTHTLVCPEGRLCEEVPLYNDVIIIGEVMLVFLVEAGTKSIDKMMVEAKDNIEGSMKIINMEDGMVWYGMQAPPRAEGA